MICLTLAPVLAGLVDILETPVEGADAATAAGLSGIRDTGGELDRVQNGRLAFQRPRPRR